MASEAAAVVVLRALPSEDHEQELYDRAREAAKEAQRQGNEQLQAAVAASRIFYPVATPVRSKRWSLTFCDRRLEAVYWRQCIGSSSIPFILELVFQLWSSTAALDSRLLLAGHTTVAACCIALIVMQMLVVDSEWYRRKRPLVHFYLVVLIWLWEILKDHFHYTTWGMIIQSMIVSLVYRVPFCVHMRVRFFGLCCQVFASPSITYSQNIDVSRLVLDTLLSHFLGSAVAYLLDRQARSAFLSKLPKWLLDTTMPSSDDSCERPWGFFYPERDSEQSSGVASPAQRRALGGFAGGFGGVSSLKCPLSPVSVADLSSSSNSFEVVAEEATVSDSSATSNDVLPDTWSLNQFQQQEEEMESRSCASVSNSSL